VFIDTSALVAILQLEADGDAFATAIEQTRTRLTSPLVRLETVMVMSRFNKGTAKVNAKHLNQLLEAFAVETVPITLAISDAATVAFSRYGKGQKHPAQLNLADCMSYAAAKVLKQPLLFKGNDFSKTDIGKVLK
jgi:ribonuclease VapC